MDTSKIASKRVVQKTAEALGDLIGNTFHQKKDNKLLTI